MWAFYLTPIILGCKIFYSCCKSSTDGTSLMLLDDQTDISNETAKQLASGCDTHSAPDCRDTAVEHCALEFIAGGIGNQDKCSRQIEMKTCPPEQNSVCATTSNEAIKDSAAMLAGSTMKVEGVMTDVNIAFWLTVILVLKLAGPKVISWLQLMWRNSTKKLAAKQAHMVVTVSSAPRPVLVCVARKAARDGARVLVHLSARPDQPRFTTRYLVKCNGEQQPTSRILNAVLALHLLKLKRQRAGTGGGGGGGGARQHRRYRVYTGRA